MFNENYFIPTQGALHVSPTEAYPSTGIRLKGLSFLLVWDFVIPWACLCLF